MFLSDWNLKIKSNAFVFTFFLACLVIDHTSLWFFFCCSHLPVHLQCRFASFSCDLSRAAASQEVIIVQVELMWRRRSMGSMSRKIGLTYYPGDTGLTPTQWIQNQVALTAKGQISATCISPISKPFTNNTISITDSRGEKNRLQLFADLTSLCIEQSKKNTLITTVH